ncbi:trypsin-like serine peptidase [Rugamonas rubra]|uniref:V8-like Glu-specific endopeptidase n=1 Tax=Rugamonas rubra TaxID=758825 RepID=A0A1I4TKG0_9BURK|nr:serine protease [Rugamonas rubra]SFM77111.1 V8-like Glu-specific endopeptidase [Rugamonas rubra]
MTDSYESVNNDEIIRAISLRGTRLEASEGSVSSDQLRDYLRQEGTNLQLERLQSVLNEQLTISSSLRKTLLGGAEEALFSMTTSTKISIAGRVGLEALICVTGRPAIATMNGNIDLDNPLLNEWAGRISPYVLDGTLAKRIRGVGRIDRAGKHKGTGFVVGPNLVLTNRHVLQLIATPIPQDTRPDHWDLHETDITIDFSDCPDESDGLERFRVTEVVAAGDDPILDGSHHLLLDAALLRVEATDKSKPFPAPIGLLSNPSAGAKNRPVMLVGYPGRPQLPKLGNEYDHEIIAVLNQLFPKYGRRYVSPGLITAAASGAKGDEDFWTFRHDATSLNGSSGSSVLALEGDVRAIGLHYSGLWRKANFAHAMPRIEQSVEFLKAQGVLWM